MSFGMHFSVQKPFSVVQCCQKQDGLNVIEQYEMLLPMIVRCLIFVSTIKSLFLNTKFLCIVVS